MEKFGTSRIVRRSLIVVFLACVVTAAGLLFGLLRTKAAPRYNVVLISIDTLRADRLGTYGYARETAPFLESISDRAAVFDRMVSVSSWTVPTHASIFTGLYPTTHGAVTSKTQIGKFPTLAQVLSRHGYKTFAFTGGGHVAQRYGFARGFDEYGESERDKESNSRGFPASLAMAERKISSLGPEDRYFLFLHTYDVHCPYNPPEPYYSMFRSEASERIDTERCPSWGRMKLNQAQVNYLSDRYDGAIRKMDDSLRGFFSFLEKRGDLARTIIVFTSDHGEEFLEHGRIGHAGALNPELVHIPLLIWAPGLPAARLRTSVSQIDLMPTVLDLLSLEAPPGIQGVSLVPLMREGDPKGEEIREFQYSELDRGKTLRSRYGKHHQLVLNVKKNEVKVFQIDGKGAPLEPLTEERTQSKLSALNAFMESLKKAAPAPAEQLFTPVPEEMKKLQTLGYL